MVINITFIIQIANFWVSYFMLDRLIFRPVVRMTNTKEAAQKLLVESLKDREHTLLKLQEEKQQNESTFKTYLKTRYVTPHTHLEEIPPVTVAAKDHEAIMAMTTELRDLLVTKAADAY